MNICGLNFFTGLKHNRVQKQLFQIKDIFESNRENKFSIIENQEKYDKLKLFDFFITCGDIKVTFNKYLIQNYLKIKDLKKPQLIRDVTYLRVIPKIKKMDVNFFPRFTWNSILPGEKNFPYDPHYNRWEDIKRKYNLHVRDYQKQGDKVLFLLQIPTDASLNELNFNGKGYLDFMLKTIQNIFEHTDREIVLRGHPLNRENDIVVKFLINYFSKNKKLSVSKNDNLEDDLKNIKCVISYNSSATVEALFSGISVINLSKMHPCFSAASNNLSDIENLKELDRGDFLNRISFLHWESDELDSKVNRKYLCDLLMKSIP